MGQMERVGEGRKRSLAETRAQEQNFGTYENYVRELKLTDEDLSKRILDVGADFGHFADVAKQEGYTDIFSVDLVHPEDRYNIDTEEALTTGKLAVADAFQLPFRDETFDLTISFCSMPNVVKGQNPIDYNVQVKKLLKELVRVTKSGGEVRLGRVVSEQMKDDLMDRGAQIQKALQKLAVSRDLQIETETTGTINGSPSYLIRIRKFVR